MSGRARRAWRLDGDGPIEIRRDAAGVPCVQASSEEDALRGLGHCHGVDRAMQLVVTRIIGRGRASETLDGGEEMQAIDRFFRRIDLAGGVQEQIEMLSARHRALLDAYADGVNRALAAGCRRSVTGLGSSGSAPGSGRRLDSWCFGGDTMSEDPLTQLREQLVDAGEREAERTGLGPTSAASPSSLPSLPTRRSGSPNAWASRRSTTHPDRRASRRSCG